MFQRPLEIFKQQPGIVNGGLFERAITFFLEHFDQEVTRKTYVLDNLFLISNEDFLYLIIRLFQETIYDN